MPDQLEKILDNSHYSANDRQTIRRAFEIADKAHAGQKRQSGEDYIIHPLSAALFLSDMGLDAATVAATLLHDTVEDTGITLSELEKQFGKEIAFLVDGVTKLKAIQYSPGTGSHKGGVDPQIESLKKMFFAMSEDIRVILIKLSDRLHNMRTLKFKSPEGRQRVARETMEIYAPIAARLGMGYFKGELEDLAFPYAYPDEYRAFMKTIKHRYDDRIKYINRVKPVIARLLSDAKIEVVDIHSRIKHFWSLYQKMRRYALDDAEKIYDLVAVRIIVPDIKSCYEALGVIHSNYKPIPGRIKDYIAVPKPNSYRSLHTTVFCEKGRLAEIQIRTPQMHDHAENGIAAHWAYSETGKKKTGTTAKAQELAWINQLKDVLKDIKTKEGLGNLKIDFFKYRIFAFTPKGDVKDLPGGATPVDFAYAIHTGLGHSVTGARVNAKMVTLDYQLKNGDVVEIIKSKVAKPSMDWLKFVKTTEARKQIQAWYKKNDPISAAINGKKMLDKELKKIGLNFDGLGREKTAELLKLFSSKTTNDFFWRISVGDLYVGDIIKHIADKSKVESSRSKVKTKRLLTPTPHLLPASVSIQGQTGLMYKIAKCCGPASGDEIRGYITRTKGVSIHLISCSNLKSAEKNRLLEAEWS